MVNAAPLLADVAKLSTTVCAPVLARVRRDGVAVAWNEPAPATIVRVKGSVALSPPERPVTVRARAVVVAVAGTVTDNVDCDPASAENTPEKPAGRPATSRATAPENPPTRAI